MNRYSRGAEPIYRPAFFDGAGAGRRIEQAEPIIGREAMKRFLEEQLYQAPADADGLLRELDEQGIVNVFRVRTRDDISLGRN
jgi:hypothetical protein